MEIENTEALEKDQLKVGDRVAAVVDIDQEKKVIVLYGYGVYEGEEIPEDPNVKFMGLPASNLGRPLGKIRLDSGQIVWSFECYVADEAKLKEEVSIEGYEERFLDIEEERARIADISRESIIKRTYVRYYTGLETLSRCLHIVPYKDAVALAESAAKGDEYFQKAYMEAFEGKDPEAAAAEASADLEKQAEFVIAYFELTGGQNAELMSSEFRPSRVMVWDEELEQYVAPEHPCEPESEA